MIVGARCPDFRSGAGKKDRAIFVPSNDLIASSRAAAVAGSARTTSTTRAASLRDMTLSVLRCGS